MFLLESWAHVQTDENTSCYFDTGAQTVHHITLNIKLTAIPAVNRE